MSDTYVGSGRRPMGPRSVYRSSMTINHSSSSCCCMRSSVVPARGRSIGRPRVRDEGGTRGRRRLVFLPIVRVGGFTASFEWFAAVPVPVPAVIRRRSRDG